MALVNSFVFDAYGTLFDVHSVIVACREVTKDAEAFSLAWRGKQLEYTWLRALMGRYEDFWSITRAALAFTLKKFNLQADPAQVAKLMEAYLHLEAFPDAPETLQALQRFPLAILSNGSPSMLEAVVEKNQFKPYFQRIISVEEVRTYKPSPLVYELAPKHLGIARNQILFVSSNSFDVVGAKAFGFQVCWANRAQGTLDELGFTPDYPVRSLDELPKALKL